MIIEDERKTADYLQRGLTEQGCAVDVAYDGIDGQHLAVHHDHDVIVLDAMLPGLNGFELLRSLRAVKNTPVIMLTARDARGGSRARPAGTAPMIIWSSPFPSSNCSQDCRR